jgi:hypothetical protein
MAFFNEAITPQKLKTIFSFYSTGPHGHDALRSLSRTIDKSVTSKLVFFYHPLRVAKDAVFEGVSWADGRMLPQTGAKRGSITRLSYLGGVSSLLPIATKVTSADSLAAYFKLLLICLKDKPEN